MHAVAGVFAVSRAVQELPPRPARGTQMGQHLCVWIQSRRPHGTACDLTHGHISHTCRGPLARCGCDTGPARTRLSPAQRVSPYGPCGRGDVVHAVQQHLDADLCGEHVVDVPVNGWVVDGAIVAGHLDVAE